MRWLSRLTAGQCMAGAIPARLWRSEAMPWFEDIKIGSRMELGSHTFTENEIIAFAAKYDPQYFHIDPEAAKKGPFGTLTASGWHTSATWMKLMIAARRANAEPPDADGRQPPAGGPS